MTISGWLIPAGFGLLSTLHCWGMCGGIVAALAVMRGGAPAPLALAFAYNGGRILSYAILGLLAGTGGTAAALLSPGAAGYRALQAIAFVTLLAAGLSLAGWWPRWRTLERVGLAFWRRIQPLSARLLPLDSLPKAVLVGMIWGLVPCALVYSMLLASAAQATPAGGFLSMLAFGLGTLPGMVAASYVAGRGGSWLRQRAVRAGAGMVVIALACAWLALQLAGNGHSAHRHPAATGAGDHVNHADHAGHQH